MFEDISAFQAVAHHKSFTKAAQYLELSIPVVTRRLARLEQNLGVRLLQRTTRHVNLTEAGEVFLTEISDVLQALEMSKETVKSLTRSISGTLKVGLPVNLSHLYITPVLHQFMELYPNVQIQLVSGDYLLDLLRTGFDLVVHCGHLPDSNFYYEKLGEWKRLFCAAPSYLEKKGIPKTIEELKMHNCIDYYENFDRTWEYQEGKIRKKIAISGNIRANSSPEIRNLALSGLGISYLGKCSIYRDLQNGSLVSILQNYQTPALGTYAVYPNKKFLSKKTKIFIDFIAEILTPVYSERDNMF
ncbi:MAG: LysR family transcriptional regulator [Proteobacteria bacterium]|nr:LysR family transcriptional regulator [Pseudomonadota bacterium]